jgi:hypothetical protein
MALINCPECNKKISDKAFACPGCGCPTNISYEYCALQNTSDFDYPQNIIPKIPVHEYIIFYGGYTLISLPILWIVANIAYCIYSGI